MSPLNYKRLRTKSATQSITLAAAHEPGKSVLSSCLDVPLGPEGDVSMDTVGDFGGASGSSELALAPITIPTLLAFPPEEAKPTEPGDRHGSGLQCSLAKLDAASRDDEFSGNGIAPFGT
jgi:hypothetical protein